MSLPQSNQANSKTAFASVLGTVTSIASSISSVFSVIENSSDIANNYVQHAAEKQTLGNTYDAATFEANLHDTVVLEQTKKLEELETLFTANPNSKKFYQISQHRLAAQLHARNPAKYPAPEALEITEA
mgnify:FL=1